MGAVTPISVSIFVGIMWPRVNMGLLVVMVNVVVVRLDVGGVMVDVAAAQVIFRGTVFFFVGSVWKQATGALVATGAYEETCPPSSLEPESRRTTEQKTGAGAPRRATTSWCWLAIITASRWSIRAWLALLCSIQLSIKIPICNTTASEAGMLPWRKRSA